MLGKNPLSLKPAAAAAAAAEEKSRAMHTRQGAEYQPVQGKGFHYSNGQTSDFLMKASSAELMVHCCMEYFITEASYGFKLTG